MVFLEEMSFCGLPAKGKSNGSDEEDYLIVHRQTSLY